MLPNLQDIDIESTEQLSFIIRCFNTECLAHI